MAGRTGRMFDTPVREELGITPPLFGYDVVERVFFCGDPRGAELIPWVHVVPESGEIEVDVALAADDGVVITPVEVDGLRMWEVSW